MFETDPIWRYHWKNLYHIQHVVTGSHLGFHHTMSTDLVLWSQKSWFGDYQSITTSSQLARQWSILMSYNLLSLPYKIIHLLILKLAPVPRIYLAFGTTFGQVYFRASHKTGASASPYSEHDHRTSHHPLCNM